MPVGNLGPDEVETVDPNDTISDAVDKLASENVGAMVVTEGGQPVGIVTDRDIALAINESDDVGSESVRTVMTEDPATIREDREAVELSETIENANARRVPIVDEEDELVGIATVDDLVATVGEQLDNVADTIEAQSPDYQP